MASDPDEFAEEYASLVRFMAQSLLNEEADIEVSVAMHDGKYRIELMVPEKIRGRVIGRGGTIARALRHIVSVAAIGTHRRVTLDIVD